MSNNNPLKNDVDFIESEKNTHEFSEHVEVPLSVAFLNSQRCNVADSLTPEIYNALRLGDSLEVKTSNVNLCGKTRFADSVSAETAPLSNTYQPDITNQYSQDNDVNQIINNVIRNFTSQDDE